MDLPSRFFTLLACLAFVGSANRAAAALPTIDNTATINGAAEDAAKSISYADLVAATRAADADPGDTITFRLDSLLAGTLTKGGSLVGVNDILATGESWSWLPPADDNGDINAFRVRAIANGEQSSNNSLVGVEVAALNDAPSFTKGADVTVIEDSAGFSQNDWATNISAGPSDENSQTVSFVLSSDLPLFSAGPAVNSSGRLTFTLAPNAFGTATITIKATDSGASSGANVNESADQQFTITVTPVNDRPSITAGPVTVPEDSGAYTGTGWVTNFTPGPANEGSQTAVSYAVTVTGNSGLFSTPPAVSANGTLTFTPAPNENGSATISVKVTDSGGTSNGGLSESVAQTFTINVTAVPDAPVLGGAILGTSAVPLTDVQVSEANPVHLLFGNLTVSDADDTRPANESLVVTVTVSNDVNLYGAFVLPTASVANGPSNNKVYTLSNKRPGEAQTLLRAATFTPVSNSVPVKDYTFAVKVEVRDSTSPTPLTATPVNGPVHFRSVNDAPEVTAELVISSTPDSGQISPFRLFVTDPDVGDTFSVTVTEVVSPTRGTLVLPSNPITGNAAAVSTAVESVIYQPSPQSSTQTATFRIGVTDVHPDLTTGTAVNSQNLPLTVVFVNSLPEISGVTTELIRTTTDPSAAPVYPFSTVTIGDLNPGQDVTVTLALDDAAKGSFSSPGPFIGTAAAVTTLLRDLVFTPTPDRLPVNDSEIVTVTITVSDGSGSRSNALTRIEVTSVNGAPRIEWDVTTQNPAGVFPPSSNPALIAPSPDALPFAKVDITSTSELVVTVSLVTPAKGELQSLGGFVETAAGSRVYQFTGSAAAARGFIRALTFSPSPIYQFPAGQPGRTDFSITASDTIGNLTTRLLPIVLRNDARVFLVTNLLDDVTSPGSLRHAVSVAGNNDVITFALPSYPATIRLKKSNGPLMINKIVSFRGPGADKLTVSGDSNANDSTDDGDVQLFSISSFVRMEGLRLARGYGATGGAISVHRPFGNLLAGTLTVEDCVFSNCKATQWGGAIDVVEGSLQVERCLFENNSLIASSAQGGGAVSLYTNRSCSFVNSTFSGNSQTGPSGFGGGAIYVENFTSELLFGTPVTHCTFSGNIDAAGHGSSIFSNVANSRVILTNNIFADFSTRNLYVDGDGEIRSNGGNLSNDFTNSNNIVNGAPGQIALLNQLTDQTNINPRLGTLGPVEGQTRGFRLLADSPAIGGGTPAASPVDQRGVVRGGSVDSGALDAEALGKLIIHEIFASQTSPDPQFIEFYNPRDQAAIDIGGYEVHIDGVKRHVFAPTVIVPGSGIILADAPLTPAITHVDVVVPSIPSVVTPANFNLDLTRRGKIEIKVPSPTGAKVIESVSYVAVFADSTAPATSLDFDLDSITLAPQFQGAAFVPNGAVTPDGGVDLAFTGDETSPGADAGKTPFGLPNAFPFAIIDRIDISEDDVAFLDVLANDLDSDGSDELVIVDLNTALSDPLPVPLTGNATLVSAAGADVVITPAASPLRGTSLSFDPRVAYNSLPAGARIIDTFAYSVIDVGGGPVAGYASAAGGTLVSASSHRMEVGDFVIIRDATLTEYNDTHEIIAITDDGFTIGEAFTSDPGPLNRGRWQSAEPRTPSARSQALVEVSILGRNDAPEPVGDRVATDEETILRIFADPDLATTGMGFDTDPLYAQPRGFAGIGLLANDDDPDTNDKPFTKLRVVGVCQAGEIGGFSGIAGESPITVNAPGHGLENGATILISGYGGHPSYNGNHVVTAVDSDSFTLPVNFVDDDAESGLWTVLNDENRFNTISAEGAPVTLEIRANRTQTNVIYNPRVPELNALADGESVIDTFYYAVEDTSGAVSLAKVSVDVSGVNDAPVPANDPDGLSSLAGLLTGGTTLPGLLGRSEVLYILPSATDPGGIDTAIRPPGGGFNDVFSITGLNHTDEDTSLDLQSAGLLANDSDVDTTDDKTLEVGPGQNISREGAAITISPDGLVVTYDPTNSNQLQALAFKERVIDTFTLTVSDGIARVDSLVAVLVEGRNDQPQASAVALTTPETDLLEVKPPGLLLSGLEIDQNTRLPDNRKFLLPVDDFTTTVFGAKVSVLLEERAGNISAFAAAAGVTAVTSAGHGIQTGEEVVILGGSALTGQYVATRIDDATFSIPVVFDAAFSAIIGGTWKVLASTFQYDPRESVFSDEPGGPVFTLQGLAAGQTYLDTYTYTLLDGSFLFANDDIFRIEADRTNVELRVLLNDTSLDGIATGRRIVETGPTSAGGTVEMNGDDSLIYTPADGFVGDEVFVYTVEDSLGNRDSARVTARVTVDRLNGNLRANADSFTVARGQTPLLQVLANDSIIPATGDPLTLDAITTAPDLGGQAVIENGSVRYTPDALATVFPYTETFAYTMSGGGTTTATAIVTVLVVDRLGTLNVRADDFSVPAGSVEIALSVLENDNILPGNGDALVISSTTAPAHGDVSIINDVLVYTPPAGFLGNDSFSYTAADGFGGTGTALVTVRVGSLTTNNDFFSVRFDDANKTEDDGVTELDVLANDNVLQGGGGLLTITGVVPKDPLLAELGVMSFTGDFLNFDPDESATGQREFIYTAADGGGRSATGTVTVVIIASGVRASSDSFTVQTDSASNELPVLSNDLRIPALADALSVAAIGTGADAPDQGGTAEISADSKRIIYTAAPGFRGVESFTYTVTDGDSSDTARVSVRSTAGDLVAANDEYFAFRGSSLNRLEVLFNDRVIPDAGQTLFISAIGMDEGNPANPPNRGTLVLIENGAALYYTPSPDNEDADYPFEETFTYEISSGGTSRSEAVVRIRVLDRVGSRDLETNDDVFTVRSDSFATVLPVLANDSVLPATTGGWTITSFTAPTANVCSPFLLADFLEPAAMAAHLTAQGDALAEYLWARFEPASQGLFANPSASELQLRVALVAEFNEIVGSGVPIYDATRFAGVVLREQTQSLLDEGVTGEQLIVLNRLLLEDALPTRLNPATGGGTVQFAGENISYAPQPGFVGTERFTYRVSDGFGGTGFAEVIVRVGDISVSDDIFTAIAGAGPVALDVTANDGILRTAFPTPADPAQADFILCPERAITVEPAIAGTAALDGAVVKFSPAAAFTGRAKLTYWVHDDSGCEFPGTAFIDVHAPGEDRDTAVASITVTGVNDAPILLNAVPSATDDRSSVNPFANATVIEYDDQRAQPVRLTVTYPFGHGVLSGDFTEIYPGVLEFYGTAAEITAALRALVFTPIIDRITVGTTEDTRFTVSMDDGFVSSPVMVDSAVTVVTPVDDLPGITGTLANQDVYQHGSLRPFAGVNITDVDDLAAQPLTVSVRIDNPIKGLLTNLSGFVEQPSGSGLYVRSGAPLEVSAALRALVFEPTPDNRVTPLSPEIVGFSISIDDAFLPPLVDTVTTVRVLHAEVDRLLPLNSIGADASEAAAAFGFCVAVSGDTMAVGSPLRDTPTANAGRVFIYERNAGFGAPWGQVAEITGSDTVVGDRFGFSLAIDGDVMVVGSPQADPGASNVGAAYVFRRDPANPNAWLQSAKLIPPVRNGSGGDLFGSAVAIQGGTILVGAPNANLSGASLAGRAFAFNLGAGGPGDWTHAQTLVALDNLSSGLSIDGEYFGYSVSFDGNTAVIGSYGANRGTSSDRWDYGAAYIFTRASAGLAWSQLKRLDEFNDPSAKAFDGFGHAVDISGDRIVVGVHFSPGRSSGFNAGGARVFERDLGGSNQWGLSRKIVPADGPLSANFGFSVAISDDLLMIGSPGSTEGVAENRGFVEVYRREGAIPAWQPIDRFSPGAPADVDRFGFSVAMDGFFGVAGAIGDGVNAFSAASAGSARVYQFQHDLGPRQTLPVPDLLAEENLPFSFTPNPATFDDPIYPGDLMVGVQLTDGDPLPAGGWLSFDPLTGIFSGTPTPSNRESYELVLVASTPLGSRLLSNAFQVSVRAEPPTGLQAAYDAWAAGEFDPAVLSDSLLEADVWGMNANPDGDAYGNLLEMLLGTDPEMGNPFPLGFQRLNATQASLTFPLSDVFPLDAVHVEWSTGMNVWSEEGVVLTPLVAGPGVRQATAVITMAAPAPKLFVRIAVKP